MKPNSIKRSPIAKTFAVAAVTVFAIGMAPTSKGADKGCSNVSLNTTFAYKSVGSLVAPPEVAGPYAEVGTETFDGAGGITGTAMLSQNGNIIPVTIKGTYKVNPDCTGTFAVEIDPLGFTAHYSFALDDTGSEIQALCVDTGAVITRIARRQFPVGDWRQ
jgi:hypothetical protein